MRKPKKIPRFLRGLLAVLPSSLIITWVPLIFDITWVPGWPEFLVMLFCVGLIALLNWLFSLKEKKTAEAEEEAAPLTPKQKRISAAWMTALAAVFLGVAVWSCFFSSMKDVSGFITSPNGKNKAIVLSLSDDMERAHPVRAWFFYEDDSYVYIERRYSTNLIKWLDEDTLQVTRVVKETGESRVESLRW